MLERLLDLVAVTVTRHRAAVLACVAAFVVFCGAQLPRLQTDASPENLIISFGGYEQRVADFQRYFGDTDSVVVLLVEAPDATQLAPLRYVHVLSRHFQSDDNVARVESLTVTALPGAEPPSEASLDDLEGLEGLDDLDEEPADPRFVGALETLIASEPERFPMGLYTVADRVGDGESDVRSIIEGDEVSEEQAAAIRAALADVPLAEGRLVSRDRTLAAVVLFLDPALGTGAPRMEAVHAIDAWLAQNPPPEGVQLHTAGIPHLRASISDHMIEDQTLLVPLSLLVCMILLFLSFRWVPGVLLTLATVGMSVIVILGLMALVGEPLTILMNTLPTLMIIMGISEAVHVMARYVDEARRTTDRVVAARRTVHQLAVACFLTSFTTAVGFGSLYVAQTEMLQRFGIVAAIGVMISYVILMTFVPAALTYFKPPRDANYEDPAPSGRLERILVIATAWIARHPWPVVLGITALMIPCTWAYSAIRVDTALRDTFDPDDPIALSVQLIDERLDGIRPLEVLVSSEREGALRDPDVLARLDRVARWADGQDGVLRTTAPSDFLWEAWRRVAGIERDAPHAPFRSREQVDALITLMGRLEHSPVENFLTEDGRHARIEVRLGDVGAQRSIRFIEGIQQKLDQELAGVEGVEISLLGEAFIGSHGTDAVVQDMFGSLALSAFIIFMMIGVLFRSARLGLLAIPPNVIPQVATVTWMYLRGIPLTASTAIVFSVAIGVSVDLTIHGFARLIEEEKRGLARRAAIVRSARGTGRAIVVSCATLVLGFGVLLLSGFVPVRHFGELIAVGLMMSLVATLVFQPAMLMLFGGRHRGRRTTTRPAVPRTEAPEEAP